MSSGNTAATGTASIQVCWERHIHYTATIDTARMRQAVTDAGLGETWDAYALATLDRIDAGERVTAIEISSNLSAYCGPDLFADLENAETTEADTKALELCQVALPETAAA